MELKRKVLAYIQKEMEREILVLCRKIILTLACRSLEEQLKRTSFS